MRSSGVLVGAALCGVLLAGGCGAERAGRLDGSTPPSPAGLASDPGKPPGEPQSAAVPPALLAELRGELTRQLAARGIALDAAGRALHDGKVISAPPVRSYLTPDRLDDLPTSTANLGWLFIQKGDYDQNGEVNISDITPIGMYFGINSSQVEWLQAQVADGDHNGVINISDITPIGQSFGVQVYGFVVEAQDFVGGPWQEFGFVPHSAGTKGGWLISYGYVAAGGIDLPDFRVAPVGPPRDFDWATYQLTDSPQDFWTAELCLLEGKPAAAFTAFRDSYGTRLHFAMASTNHPLSTAEWNIEYGIAFDYMGFDPPALANVFNEPVIAYFADAAPAADLRYLRRDYASGVWGSHIVTTFMAYRDGLDLATRLGRPVIFVDDSGLLTFYSGVNIPSSNFDWGTLASNPALTSFSDIDALCSGPWLFACGLNGTLGQALAFSRSKAATPMFQSDFSEFIAANSSSSYIPPSLALPGGVPAIATMDNFNAAVLYSRAASRTDDSPAAWQTQTVAGGDGYLARTENPELCLIDGRPAIVAGADPMTFYWAKVADPTLASDWRVQTITTAQPHTTHSMLSVEGFPVIAYEVYSDASASKQVAIAVAQEN